MEPLTMVSFPQSHRQRHVMLRLRYGLQAQARLAFRTAFQ
jgi:hypothetical protein